MIETNLLLFLCLRLGSEKMQEKKEIPLNLIQLALNDIH